LTSGNRHEAMVHCKGPLSLFDSLFLDKQMNGISSHCIML
jgi:hypothetical protein